VFCVCMCVCVCVHVYLCVLCLLLGRQKCATESKVNAKLSTISEITKEAVKFKGVGKLL